MLQYFNRAGLFNLHIADGTCYLRQLHHIHVQTRAALTGINTFVYRISGYHCFIYTRSRLSYLQCGYRYYSLFCYLQCMSFLYCLTTTSLIPFVATSPIKHHRHYLALSPLRIWSLSFTFLTIWIRYASLKHVASGCGVAFSHTHVHLSRTTVPTILHFPSIASYPYW